MRKSSLALLLSLLLAPAGLWAFDVGLEARASSLQFPWSQTSETVGTAAWAPALSRWFWGGAGWLDMPLGEDFELHMGYETDPVIRNVVSSLFRFDRGIASMGVGPFIGFLNDDGRLASFGLSTFLQVQWPGRAYLSARSDGGLALGLVAGLSSVPQTRAELAAGFYTPNAIVSAVLSGKRFNQLDSDGLEVDDNLTRYALVVDIYKKNIPYQLRTTLGYEQRSKHWAASDLTDSLGSAILGLKLTVEAGADLKLYGEFTNAVFTFGMDNLKGRSPSTKDLLYSASLGLQWSIDPEKARAWSASLFAPKKAAAQAEGVSAAPAAEGAAAAPTASTSDAATPGGESGGAAPPEPSPDAASPTAPAPETPSPTP